MLIEIMLLIMCIDLIGCAWIDYLIMEEDIKGTGLRQCMTKTWWN